MNVDDQLLLHDLKHLRFLTRMEQRCLARIEEYKDHNQSIHMESERKRLDCVRKEIQHILRPTEGLISSYTDLASECDHAPVFKKTPLCYICKKQFELKPFSPVVSFTCSHSVHVTCLDFNTQTGKYIAGTIPNS